MGFRSPGQPGSRASDAQQANTERTHRRFDIPPCIHDKMYKSSRHYTLLVSGAFVLIPHQYRE